MEYKEIEKKLKAPFKKNEIEWRITATNKEKTKGLAIAYITNRAIQNRLDEVVGFNNWKNEFIVNPDKSKICGISIKFENEWVTKYDGASDTDIEATKGGLSNAMKRAASQWGIGRYLYNLKGQWVKIKQQGRSYAIDEIPTLPDWATPNFNQTSKKDFNWEEKEEIKPEKLSDNVQKCINSFKKIGISKFELETYLQLEAVTFTNQDLDTLRTIYLELKSGKKKKEDYFYIEPEKSGKIQNKEALKDLLN